MTCRAGVPASILLARRRAPALASAASVRFARKALPMAARRPACAKTRMLTRTHRRVVCLASASTRPPTQLRWRRSAATSSSWQSMATREPSRAARSRPKTRTSWRRRRRLTSSIRGRARSVRLRTAAPTARSVRMARRGSTRSLPLRVWTVPNARLMRSVLSERWRRSRARSSIRSSSSGRAPRPSSRPGADTTTRWRLTAAATSMSRWSGAWTMIITRSAPPRAAPRRTLQRAGVPRTDVLRAGVPRTGVLRTGITAGARRHQGQLRRRTCVRCTVGRRISRTTARRTRWRIRATSLTGRSGCYRCGTRRATQTRTMRRRLLRGLLSAHQAP
mmetsp:Transcript_42387/g.127049  ORF Transcript_42387/g.127049 Transcript_42387/m.127049 type:complete len:334 (-) Transcript_42387:915-1916(-)